MRNPGKAASNLNLWSNDIENGLSVHDNKAAQIYREKISGKPRIELTGEEFTNFSSWLAQFYVRAPKRKENFKTILSEIKQNPAPFIRELIYRSPEEYLSEYRSKNSEIYGRIVAKLGQINADAYILDAAATFYSNKENLTLPEAETLYHEYMYNNRSEQFGEILRRYRWRWVRSTHGFVIGDHPLVAWHEESKRWDYGIDEPGVEVTMPLSVDLSLVLTEQTVDEIGDVADCDEGMSRRLNCRQRLAATMHVFGNTPELLDFVTHPVIP